MPLLDHFHPPLSRTHPWRAFHGAWAAAMARLLNAGVLPSGFYAIPFLDRDGPVEIDVASLQEANSPEPNESGEVTLWTPPQPALSIAVEWPEMHNIRVEIHSEGGDPQLAAAVELVSPRNKDRQAARTAFVEKCANHLRLGAGVVVVDVVTTRRADLHADLLVALGSSEIAPSTPDVGGSLTAVSYRSVNQEGEGSLQVWTQVLAMGQTLPTLPLWLAGLQAVPLNLETSHAAACEDLRIRQAG